MNNAHIDLVWRNYPSDESPVDEENLNRMVRSINLTDENVHNLDENKASKEELLEHTSKLFKDVQYNKTNGILTFTRKNGETITIDTPLEMVALDIFYDPVTEMLTLPLEGGGRFEVDLSRLITELEFLNSDTIAISVEEGKVKAIIKEGSIQEKHLRPDYLADIRVEQGKAQLSAGKSEEFAKLSESYAHGGTGVREGEGSDNAMEYARQAKESADRAEEAVSGAAVTGVKGECEPGFRTGNVVIYPQNIFKTIVFKKSIPQSEEWEEILSGESVLKVSGVYVAYIKIVNPYDESEIKGGYAGIMHWDPSGLNYGGTDEILLHSSKELNNGARVYLRTQRERDVIGNAKLRLQISFSEGSSSNVSLIIEFMKIL